MQKGPNGYDKGFIWAPPSILWRLWQFRPQVIFTVGFDIWTLYAFAFKAYAHCRMILLWGWHFTDRLISGSSNAT